MSEHVTIAVIGAGLAGTTLIEALLREGVDASSLALIEAGEPGAGASGGPGAMLNPLPGRSMAPVLGYEASFPYAYNWLKARCEKDPGLGLQQPMLRPLMKDKGGEKMRRAFERGNSLYAAPIQGMLLEEAEAKVRYPFLGPHQGTLVVEPCIAFNFGRLVLSLVEEHRQQGVHVHTQEPVLGLRQENCGHWQVVGADGIVCTAERVVLALGAGLDEWFPQLPMQMNGGELAVVKPPAGAALPCMVSAGGYVMSRPDGHWVLGSTFWHGQKHSDASPQESLAILLRKLTPVIPALAEAELVSTWFGVRAIYRPDRQPLIGAVPGCPGLYLQAAFASKGMLWIPWVAQQSARVLCQGAQEADCLPTTVHLSRVDKVCWEPGNCISLAAM